MSKPIWNLDIVKRKDLKDDVNQLSADLEVKTFIKEQTTNDDTLIIITRENSKQLIKKVAKYTSEDLFKLIDFVESQQIKENTI